jgi:hypothetical protein
MLAPWAIHAVSKPAPATTSGCEQYLTETAMASASTAVEVVTTHVSCTASRQTLPCCVQRPPGWHPHDQHMHRVMITSAVVSELMPPSHQPHPPNQPAAHMLKREATEVLGVVQAHSR